MKISLRWFKQYLNTDCTIEELVETLTMAGIEVEGEIDLGMKSGKIVVGRVREVRKHPNADKLSLCHVDVGQGRTLSIVCGAPNVTVGGCYPCALPGAVLPGGVTIKKTRLRGEPSEGMLCSARELELGADQSGLLDLPESYRPGDPLDYVLEVTITPNRPDCLSLLGIARDLGAMMGKKVYPPRPQFKEMLEPIDSFVRLMVEARAQCPRYVCRLIRDVEVGESPVWLKRALEASGLRPINNVVDVTNYVLMELGHPLHAFDCDTLEGGEVRVRLAQPGEPLVVIDGTRLELTGEDLVIADKHRPIALAGVMGGAETEVSAGTSHVLLESAYFEPQAIRRTARRHGMSTDASYRFERGTDRSRLTLPLNRAAQLIQELAGGEIAKNYLDVQGTILEQPPILLNTERANRLLGLKLSSMEIADYLLYLGFEITRSDRESLVVKVPSHRIDVTREVDLVEEVARLHNYNRIPSTLPRIIHSARPASEHETLVEDVRSAMGSLGFCEALNYSFISEHQSTQFGQDPGRMPHIANPLTVDQGLMRHSLLPRLIEAALRNRNQDEPSILLFEVGKVWRPGAEAGQADGECWHLAAVMTGQTELHWDQPARMYDFYDLKGVLEALFDRFGESRLEWPTRNDSPVFHPARTAGIVWSGHMVGETGELHPELADALDLKQRLYAVQIDLDRLVELEAGRARTYRPITRYPGTHRDLALVVGDQVEAGRLVDTVREAGGALVEQVKVFDLYQGEHVPEGKKSLALRLRLRSVEKTLTEEEITGTVDVIVQALSDRYEAVLRT